MKRLCFISPDVERTRKAVNALRAVGVGGSNLMVIARSDIALEELPAAGIDQTDAAPGLARGLAAGGVIGAVAGILVIAFEDVGLALGGGAIPLFALFGAGVSGLATLLAGASVSSSRLHRFQQAIQGEGKILLMVDVATVRAQEIKEIVRKSEPAVEFAGEEPPTPIIPP
ncbi:MAG: DUF1269 domain-containing protein [Steroidobacteraceae bacterium]